MMRRVLSVMMLGLILGSVGTARAAIVLTATEVGNDVVVSGGGSANLDGLTLPDIGYGSALMKPNGPDLITGPTAASYGDVYNALHGPTSFGSGGFSIATSGTGDTFGVLTGLGLVVPESYISGGPLTTTDTYANQTFASLGMTPGTYVWTWGTGANSDSFTLNIKTAAVPEPSSLLLCGMAGLAGLGLAWRRRNSTAA